MRHRRRVKHFSRKSGPRKALLRGLIVSLVEHERIKTTVEKAKELRRHVEKAITVGKAGDLSAIRLLMERIPNKKVVEKIVKVLAPIFKDRKGGYTRIIKIGRRPGDSAEMAFIEFVNYDFKTKSKTKASAKDLVDKKGKSTAKKDSKEEQVVTKEDAKLNKQKIKLLKKKKKVVRKIKAKSRVLNRPKK